MLSTSHFIRRKAQQTAVTVLNRAKFQFRFASHSSDPKVSEITRLINDKKLESRIKNVPLELLYNPGSSPSPNTSFLGLGSHGSVISGSDNYFSTKILANSNNDGNNDDSSPPKPHKTPSKSENQDKKDDSKPVSKSKKEPNSDKPDSNAPEIVRKGTRSSRSKSPKNSSTNGSSKLPSSFFQSKTANPKTQTNNTDRFFTVASASEKKQILILPINRRPLIPGFHKAVDVKDKDVIKALRKIYDENLDDQCVGVFLLKEENGDADTIKSADDVYPVGVYARIGGRFENKGDGVETFLLYPTHRIQIGDMMPTPASESSSETAPSAAEGLDAETSSNPEPVSEVTEETAVDGPKPEELDGPHRELYSIPASWSSGAVDLEDLPYDPHSSKVAAYTAEILRVLKELSTLNRPLKDQVVHLILSGNKFTKSNVYEEPHVLADFAASVSAGHAKDIQDVLASMDIEQRLDKALVLVKRELMNVQLQEKISADVDNRIQKRQREYFLMEQLKGIKRELGMDDGREKLIQTFKDKAAKLAMPDVVAKVFDDEVAKLMTLEPAAAEYNVTRQYLDWLTQVPWGKYSKDSYNIKNAVEILNQDHYGLKDVKDRILEFIAVGKLLGTVDGKIVCFVGPPGVGKTSVAKSIAKALNREFYRFSIGGVSDVSELKGHRRTYVGALPGRIVQALKKTQTQNPLILIDEIDKIGRAGYHGDPSAALLELLDPEQNSSFLDHYMDVPIDMSKTLFVCTANTLDTIPGPLLDRMEVIEISGYVAEEKIAIAEKYLAPNARKLAGLEHANVSLTHEAIEGIISKYARESGVRNLKKQIEKIYRKAALNIIKKVGEDNFEEEEVVDVEAKEESQASDEKPSNTEPEIPAEENIPEPEINHKPQTIQEAFVDSFTKPKSSTTPSTEANKEEVSESDSKEAETKSASTSGDETSTINQHKPLKVPEDISIEITPSDLKDYIGPPLYVQDRMYEQTPIGVVMGLGVTSMGGSTLYVESVLEQPLSIDSRAGLSQTGQLGSTMKESSNIAYSFARMFIGKNFPENRFFERARIHLHCPEGAIPKDGPSAGITMTTSLLSLALNHSLDPTIAMTGELTLTGRVLRIGGLREKSVAAKRSGAKTIFFPKDNIADWEAMPENVKEGLEPVPVEWYSEVFDRAFQTLDRKAADHLWEKQFEKIDSFVNKSREEVSSK